MAGGVEFFATQADQLSVFREIESEVPIHYALAGNFDNPAVREFSSAAHIPHLGVCQRTSGHLGMALLVAHAEHAFSSSSFELRKGGTRYSVDWKVNPTALSLIPGGEHDRTTLLAGGVGALPDNVVAQSLLKVFARVMRRRWVRIQSYRVGEQALRIFEAGGRLTADVKSPTEYDLRR